jgi:hypothetical protein
MTKTTVNPNRVAGEGTRTKPSKGQLIAGTVIAVFLIGGITSVLGGGSDSSAPAPAAPAPITVTQAAPPAAPEGDNPIVAVDPDDVDIPTVKAGETAPAEVTEPMPDVVGMNLQAAQDKIQEGGVFYSKSEDATGMKRHQILDSDWVVVAQYPAVGETIGNGDAVLSVVKIGEHL